MREAISNREERREEGKKRRMKSWRQMLYVIKITIEEIPFVDTKDLHGDVVVALCLPSKSKQRFNHIIAHKIKDLSAVQCKSGSSFVLRMQLNRRCKQWCSSCSDQHLEQIMIAIDEFHLVFFARFMNPCRIS